MSAQRVTTAVILGLASCCLAQPPAGPCGNRTVAIVVQPSLVNSIRPALNQFERDLCASGYTTIEHSAGFGNAAAHRAYLRAAYSKTGGSLAGAILMGDFPRAYQWVTLTPANPSIPSLSEEVISLQYYADLDGTFAKSPLYTSPGGHLYSFDLHTGDTGWEIWIAVLPTYKGDPQRTTAALNRYFTKNHAYRVGKLTRPNVFLEVDEHAQIKNLAEHTSHLADMRAGQYAWTPFSSTPGALLYFNSPPAGMTVQQGYAAMRAGLADFTVTGAHGSWAGTGQLSIANVESSPVKTLFFWSDGCAVGDLDHADNFLTSLLYSLTSEVLVAKGTTNNSGGMGTNLYGFFGHNIATALAASASFGDAVLSHVNVPLIAPWSGDREFHFGTPVILGDPTLLRLSTSGPDLVPTSRAGPPGFCRIAKTGPNKGNLLVTVTNRGNGAAPASVTLVQFNSGGSVILPTPALSAGAFFEAPVGIPAACYRPDCGFKITVDLKTQVKESDKGNNTAAGSCLG